MSNTFRWYDSFGKQYSKSRRLCKRDRGSFATVNRWEKGKTKPTFSTRRKIDDYCKKRLIDFDVTCAND